MACFQVHRLSTNVKAKIGPYKCERCVCVVGRTKQRIFMVQLEFKGLLTHASKCDETLKLIPNRSRVLGNLNYTLRTGRCPDARKAILWGCHNARWRILDPSGRSLFAGTSTGTRGFDPRTAGARRCCFPHDLGAMRLRGAGKLRGFNLCATYLVKIPFLPTDPCRRKPDELAAQLDGVVMAAC